MRHGKTIILLLAILYGCYGGEIAIRDHQTADQTGGSGLCAGQTQPSPQCPAINGDKKENGANDDKKENDNDDDNIENSERVAAQQTYTAKDGKNKPIGNITIKPLNLDKDHATQLQVTFTAAEDISQSAGNNLWLKIRFPATVSLQTVELDPDAPTVTFFRRPYKLNEKLAQTSIKQMAEGEQFTQVLTVVAQETFTLDATIRSYKFKDPQGNPPTITVQAAGSPPPPPPDPSPVYKSPSNRLWLRIDPFPHSLPQSGGVLTLTFTANMNMRKKSYSRTMGQRKYRYKLILAGIETNDYKVKFTEHKLKKKSTHGIVLYPSCTVPSTTCEKCSARCSISIVEMSKGQSFSMELKVTATKTFRLRGDFTKLKDGLHPDLPSKPLIEVK